MRSWSWLPSLQDANVLCNGAYLATLLPCYLATYDFQVNAEADNGFVLRYLDINIGDPEIREQIGVRDPATPMRCRLRNLTYEAPIYVHIEYTKGRELHRPREPFIIGYMPMMLRSSKYATDRAPR